MSVYLSFRLNNKLGSTGVHITLSTHITKVYRCYTNRNITFTVSVSHILWCIHIFAFHFIMAGFYKLRIWLTTTCIFVICCFVLLWLANYNHISFMSLRSYDGFQNSIAMVGSNLCYTLFKHANNYSVIRNGIHQTILFSIFKTHVKYVLTKT